MGKNKNKKQNEAGNDSGAKKDNPTEPLTNFVPIVSCFYCDVVSFDVNDQENYGGHLKKAHNINKNTEALVDVTLKLQSGKSFIIVFTIFLFRVVCVLLQSFFICVTNSISIINFS